SVVFSTGSVPTSGAKWPHANAGNGRFETFVRSLVGDPTAGHGRRTAMRTWTGGMALALLSVASVAAAQDSPSCKAVHADLVEDFSTQGCEPPSTACFLGEVDGNHGLRGTTRFDSDSGAAGPSTSP